MEGRKRSSNHHPYSRNDDRRKSLLSIVGDTIKEMLSPSWLTDLVQTVSVQPPAMPGTEDKTKEKFLSPKHTEMEQEFFHSTSQILPHTTHGNGQPRTHDFQLNRSLAGTTVPTPLKEFTSSQLPLTMSQRDLPKRQPKRHITEYPDNTVQPPTKSLLSIMWDTIKEMLSPSWLTDLVQTVSEEPPATPGAEDKTKEKFLSPKHTEMEQEFFHSTSQILPHTTHGNGQPRTHDFPLHRSLAGTTVPAPLKEFTSSQLPLTMFTEKSDSVLAHDENTSQQSDTSTSGCSSMTPKPSSQPKLARTSSSGSGLRSPLNSSRVPAQKLKLWTTQPTYSPCMPQIPAIISNRPAFNPLLYGSPLNATTPVGYSPRRESSFYSGKATFGGMSPRDWPKRQPKRRTTESPDSTVQPPTKIKVTAKQNDRPVVTAITTRILEVMQSLDTNRPPQKIPSFIFPKNMGQTYSCKRRPDPPSSNLNPHASAAISRNRLSSSGLSNTNPGRPSREDRLKVGTFKDTSSGKMRNEKSYHTGSSAVKMATESEVAPTTAFQFSSPISVNQVETMEKRSVPQSRPESVAQAITTQASVAQSRNQPSKAATPVFNTAPRPKAVSIELPVQKAPTAAASELKQGSVMDILGGGAKPASTAPAPLPTTASLPAPSTPKLSDMFKTAAVTWECSGCLLQCAASLQKCVACGTSRPAVATAPLATTASLPAPKLSDMFKTGAGTWECPGCLLQCAASLQKCVACRTSRPAAATAPPATTAELPVQKAPAAAASELKQGSVMDILGGGAKPASTAPAPLPTTASLPAPSAPKLSDMFKTAAGTWECSGCLLQCTTSLQKCVACGTSRPAAATTPPATTAELPVQKAPTAAASELKQGSVMDILGGGAKPASTAPAPLPTTASLPAPSAPKLSDMFKTAAGTWECSGCLVQCTTSLQKCVACGTSRPAAATTPPATTAGMYHSGLGHRNINNFLSTLEIRGLHQASCVSGLTEEEMASSPRDTIPDKCPTPDVDPTPHHVQPQHRELTFPSTDLDRNSTASYTDTIPDKCPTPDVDLTPHHVQPQHRELTSASTDLDRNSHAVYTNPNPCRTPTPCRKTMSANTASTADTMPVRLQGCFKYDMGWQKRGSGRAKELRDGITYEPTIDTTSQHADIQQIPTAIFPPAVERVKECSYNKVFCDIETSSLYKEADILQLSAICDSDKFDQYITPTQSVSPAATAVNGLTTKGGVLFHDGVPVSTLPLQHALQLFVNWLDEQSPVILIGHNFRTFDFPRIIRAVGIAKLRPPFAAAVIGAVDTLPLMKSIYPNRKSYKQETLVSDVLQEPYEAHNAMADVISLQKLFSASHVSEDLANQHSFTTSWAFKMFDYQQQADKNMYTMTNIINGNVITKSMAKTIAKSGLRLEHLQLAFDRGGIDGLSQILSERVDGKIRVTANKRVIASLSSHFDK